MTRKGNMVETGNNQPMLYRITEQLGGALSCIPVGLRARLDGGFRETFVKGLVWQVRTTGEVDFWDYVSLEALRNQDYLDAQMRIEHAKGITRDFNYS
jgi:hypothetical protein